MSSIPLTDTAVMTEMKEADKRCTAIAGEIEQLKKELTELTNVIKARIIISSVLYISC